MTKDQTIFDLIEQERQRQLKGMELIASENFVSDDVMRAMGSCLTNKYAEGYPAVSIKLYLTPSRSTRVSIASRVVPAISDTIERSSPAI